MEHYYELAVLQFNKDDSYTLFYPEFCNGDVIKCASLAELEYWSQIISSL